MAAPSFRLLSDDQIQEIHSATLEVLERTGVDVRHGEARQMLAAAGCRVQGLRVRYPATLVERCLAQAPSRVVLHDRDGRRAMFLEGRRSYFGLGSDTLQAKPFVIHYSEPNSPLLLTEAAVDKLLLCAELGIPLLFTPGSMTGGTAPVTRAGAVVISNAESLSALVLHQLKRPGAPIISGGNSMVMDLMTAICSYGAPEFQLAIAAYTELYHHYRIPVWGFAGCSDAHLLDEQAALEATFSIMVNALAGANLIHDVGYLSSGLTASCELMVLSDEIIGMVKRLLAGIPVEPETLAIEAIDRVGPAGHYLTDEHTLAHFRSEFWRPGLLNRDPLEIWQRKGSLPLRERLRRRVQEILEKHRPPALPASVQARLGEIIRQAQA